MNSEAFGAALRRLAPGLLLAAALLLLFRDTATAMVTIWLRSDTFAHAILVPPIALWLVWRRRALLATLQPRPAPWLVLPMAAVCVLWLLGELASVNAATQLALVSLLVLSVPAIFGLAVARAVTFPLIFLVFSVPIGEFMVPTMMEWTADFTVAAVQMSGVPVYREGLQFVIPSGNWSVVEACSGVRYLIASLMVGTLFAYLNYRSPVRRAVFMLASLLVPILANWFRAYLIVMLGHLSGNKLAAGVDHIIYGWVFFGIVIGIMFLIGARWSEPEEPVPAAAAGVGGQSSAGPVAAAASSATAWAVGGAIVLMLAATQAVFWRLDNADEAAAPQLALPAAPGGWSATGAPFTDWVPAYKSMSAVATQSYAAAGSPVGVWVGYYRNQNYERKLVSSANLLAEQTLGAPWAKVGEGQRRVPMTAGELQVRTADMRGTASPVNLSAPRLRVWQTYWVGGRLVTSDARAKVHLAIDRLLGRGDDSAVVFFYTPVLSDSNPELADATLGRFVAVAMPPLQAALVAASSRR